MKGLIATDGILEARLTDTAVTKRKEAQGVYLLLFACYLRAAQVSQLPALGLRSTLYLVAFKESL